MPKCSPNAQGVRGENVIFCIDSGKRCAPQRGRGNLSLNKRSFETVVYAAFSARQILGFGYRQCATRKFDSLQNVLRRDRGGAGFTTLSIESLTQDALQCLPLKCPHAFTVPDQ